MRVCICARVFVQIHVCVCVCICNKHAYERRPNVFTCLYRGTAPAAAKSKAARQSKAQKTVHTGATESADEDGTDGDVG
jgi:hypothetical protein